MQPTATTDPATDLVTRNRPAFAAACFLAAALCLVPTVRYGTRAFAAPTPPAPEAKEDPAALDKKPDAAAADPNRADNVTFALAGALGTLLCLGGGLWAAFGLQPPTEDERAALARRALLVVGSGLGGLAMLLGLAMFYLWFESLTKWLNDGDTTQAKWVLIPVAVFLAGAGLTFLAVQPARSEERTNQGLRRLVYAVNLGLTAFLLFAVLLIGNVFASLRIPNRLDTTEGGFYTLDPKTQEYLAKLETPVNAYATLPEGDRFTDDARRLLIASQEVNPAKFKVKFLSLTLNRDEIARLKGRYPQADLNELGILLTAGENETRSAFIRANDLFKQEGGGFGGGPQRLTFTGEAAVVRELLYLTDPGGKPVIYFTQGHGELEVVPNTAAGPRRGPTRPANQLRSVLEKGYAEVRTWEPEATAPKVPADCAVLVVADPKFPLAKETAAAVTAYMTEARDGKKGKLIVLAGPNPRPQGGGLQETGLEEVLAGLTIRLGNRLVVGRPTREGLVWDEHLCIFYPAAHSVAQMYQGKGVVMTGVRTVEPGAPPGMGGPVAVEPLLITEPGRYTVLESEMPTDPAAAWNDMVKNPQLRSAKQLTGEPRVVAVVASEGQTNRAAVIGCGAFFADPTGRSQQSSQVPAEIFANVVSWIRDRPAAAAVANKTYGEYAPNKSADTFRLYFLPVGLTVLAVVALGAGVWVVRRK